MLFFPKQNFSPTENAELHHTENFLPFKKLFRNFPFNIFLLSCSFFLTGIFLLPNEIIFLSLKCIFSWTFFFLHKLFLARLIAFKAFLFLDLRRKLSRQCQLELKDNTKLVSIYMLLLSQEICSTSKELLSLRKILRISLTRKCWAEENFPNSRHKHRKFSC